MDLEIAFKESHTQTPHIYLLTVLPFLFIEKNFGREVKRSANVWLPNSAFLQTAKIRDFEFIIHTDDVFWFYVSMNHLFLMDGLQGIGSI